MSRLTRFLITLPVLAVPFQAMGLKQVAAETVTPAETVKLLAKAEAMDATCNYLDDASRQELSDYAARAEIAAAERNSVATAKAAVDAGRSSGQATNCNDEAKAAVMETLAAARSAVAVAERRVVTTANRRSTPRAKVLRPTQVTLSPTEVQELGKGGLEDYADRAMAYYVERRCRHLKQRDAVAFWTQIVRRHKAAIALYKRGRVAAALRLAEAKADSQPCGTVTASLVRLKFAETIRR